MSDLIRRQDVLAYPIREDHYDREHGNKHFIAGIESVMEYVECLPSAEPKTPSNGSITCVKSEKMHDRTMGDLISRQDACEAVKNEMESWLEGDRCDYRNVVDAIMDLPSAEKAQLSEEGTTKDATYDSISRKDAIDAVEFGITYAKAIDVNTGESKELFKEGNDALKKAVERLKELPSTKPEVIRCKDCKHFHYDKPYVVYDIPVLGHEVCDKWGDGCKTSENGFCFMAERRGEEE